MNQPLTHLIFLAGLGQITILIASILVPSRLNWQDELRSLGRLHRQMHWVYGGYVVLSIIAFAALSIRNSAELASGSALARGFCGYVAVFWGIRLALQAIFDIKEYLNTWWTKAGYFALSLMFAALTIVYSWAALQACPAPSFDVVLEEPFLRGGDIVGAELVSARMPMRGDASAGRGQDFARVPRSLGDHTI